MAERPAAVLLVLAPSGQRSRVTLDSIPFSIGRQSGNSLVLRDNRTSRNHCRIVFENGSYAIEDLSSRHGTFVNGRQISRRVLHNSDRIEFGVRDSYQLTFSAEQQDIQRLLGQFGSVPAPTGDAAAAGNLVKLRSLVEVARALQNSLRERGVRLTRQRRILLDLLDRSGKHLNAETLYQLAKEKDPKLNRVTVYRTLKLLKAGGLIDELDLLHFEGDQHYYESRLKQEHAHLICLRCGKVEEFFGEPLQKMRRQMESSLGFKIVTARTEMGGYCPDCQSQLAQESAEKARTGQIG